MVVVLFVVGRVSENAVGACSVQGWFVRRSWLLGDGEVMWVIVRSDTP